MGSSENIQVRLTGRGLFVAHVTAGLLGTPSLFATLNFLHGLHTGKGKKIPVDDAEALRWQSMKEASDPLGLALTAVLLRKAGELVKEVCSFDEYRAFLTADATEIPLKKTAAAVLTARGNHDIALYGVETRLIRYAVELVKDPRSVPASPHKLNSLTFIAPHIGSRLALNNRNLILQPPPGADYSKVDHVKGGEDV